MRIEAAFLKTRVARRVLGLFVLCALIPLGALAVVSYRQVGAQLRQQSRTRLVQASKLLGMSLVERIQVVDNQMRVIAAGLAGVEPGSVGWRQLGADASLPAEQLAGLSLARGGRVVSLLGRVAPPILDAAQQEHLRSGRPVLVLQDAPAGASRVLLGRPVDPAALERGLLWAEVRPEYLWGESAAALPPAAVTCVLRSSGVALFCTGPAPGESDLPEPERATEAVVFEWSSGGQDYIASRYSVFLQFGFRAPPWTIVLSEPKASVLAPAARFRQTFGLTVLLALWVVLVLSNVQIRRSLEPLEKLRDGTQRLAARQFDQPVEVRSGDEFEDLAQSFNTMAQELKQQFGALSAINEIDRAALSQLDADRIIEAVLARVPEAVPCDSVSLALSRRSKGELPWQLIAADRARTVRATCDIRPSAAELGELHEHPEFLVKDVSADQDGVVHTPALAACGIRSYLVLPLFLKRHLSGFIALGHRKPPQHSTDDLVRARQLADQVAVALSNSRLLEELDGMNWGTLEALARTIDAKSPWTAGHSERVTAMALQIAGELALSEEELDTLHRGGLLHDIGKIGVPAGILDKPGPLTTEEMQIMQSHTTMGARVVAPIEAYEPTIPIVLYHHEKWDGTGYPEGLAGEAIPFLARVLCVPDVFDAVTSERPYRLGWPFADAVEHIRRFRGKLFDPTVADALLALAGRGEVVPQGTRVEGAAPTRVRELRRA